MPDETPDPTEAAPTTPDDGTPEDPLDRADTPPAEAVDEAERLTRLAREAEREDARDGEAEAYREARADLLAGHDYAARVREDDTRDVLVVHPQEWMDDGTIRTDRVEDIDRGIEVPLSGPGAGDDWAVIDSHNRDVVASVREVHGDTHAANVAALADFAGNHYAKPVEDLTAGELREFLEDYFRRNAWPTAEQRDAVEKSVQLAFDAVDERCPL